MHRWASTHKDSAPHSLKRKPQRQNTADLFRDDEPLTNPERRAKQQQSSQKHEAQQDPVLSPTDYKKRQDDDQLSTKDQSALTASLKQMTLPSSPTFPRSETKAYLGRDGGGSRSGAASPFEMSDEEYFGDSSTTATAAESNGERSANLEVPPSELSGSMARALRGELNEGRVLADALGDHSEPEIEQADEEVGTRDRERREIARIVAEEVRERTHHGDVY